MNTISELAGKPREGVHAIRLFDFAVVDIAATGVGAYALSKLSGYSFLATFAGLFALGELAHFAFKVDTKFTEIAGFKFEENGDENRCPFAL